MKVVFKLACKNLLTNKKRTLFTLLCVIFSLSLIGIVFGILDSLFSCINFQNDIEAEQATRQISTAFIIVSCFMSCLSIYTAFSISIQERIKSFGFLRITLAIETLCFSPPESLSPLLPTMVSNLSGNLSINVSQFAK